MEKFVITWKWEKQQNSVSWEKKLGKLICGPYNSTFKLGTFLWENVSILAREGPEIILHFLF